MDTGSHCPVCGALEGVPFFTKQGYHIVRCQGCSALYVCPMPSAETLEAHYRDPAYFSGQEEQGYRDYAAIEKALAPHLRRRLRALNARLPGKGRLLDFGCAAGYFLKAARADGWQITGVELADGMARQASAALGIPIARSLDNLGEDSLDAITLWEVLEHLPRPVEQLRRLHDTLRPGGILMVSTPNTGHWQAAREPARWEGYRPPSHLVFFTEVTLREALTRAGFAHIEVRRVAPLPPMPAWLRRASAPLQRAVTTGEARPWLPALLTWRLVRLLGWGWQRIARPKDDIFTSLEAVAARPTGDSLS